jgi:hypothetical protein
MLPRPPSDSTVCRRFARCLALSGYFPGTFEGFHGKLKVQARFRAGRGGVPVCGRNWGTVGGWGGL